MSKNLLKTNPRAAILLLILIVVGSVYFYFYKTQHNKKDSLNFYALSAPAVFKDLDQTYTSDKYNFSFNYPKGLQASSIPSDSGDVVVVADSKGLGFQIYITPFDEPISVLSVERIKKDATDLAILNPQDVILGADAKAGKGVAFLDGDGLQANRQVWFIYAGHLYQITAPVDFDATLQNVLNTWKFE